MHLSEDTSVRGKEMWRDSKILGSKLDTSKDIKNRINLGCAVFQYFKKMWKNNSYINTDTKIRIYEAMVTPILLYNSGTWAGPKNIMEKVNTCQRNHLRQILNIKWPRKITNQHLYETTKVIPLSERVKRWKWNTNVPKYKLHVFENESERQKCWLTDNKAWLSF